MLNRARTASGRFSYSLRGLFVVVTALVVLIGWNVNLIRQRHELIAEQRALLADFRWLVDEQHVPAPWYLRPFGERGWQTISVILPKGASRQRYLEKARRLFPEAEFIDVVGEQLLTDDELEEMRRPAKKQDDG